MTEESLPPDLLFVYLVLNSQYHIYRTNYCKISSEQQPSTGFKMLPSN